MADLGIDDIRALLSAKPRPVGWPARRARIEEVGAAWPVAPDISLEPASIDGIAAEWSCAPTSDPSRALLFFHGGGYCSGSIVSHRRMVSEAGRAGQHLRISKGAPAKTGKDKRVATSVAVLAEGERREEIARMLSGAAITEEARAAAARLLEGAG